MPPLTFPSLHDLSLSQAPEDQESLRRIKALWDEYASGWDEQTRFAILTNLKHVRANHSNKRSPYNHRLRGVEFNFGIWVILKCVYPLNKLESQRNQLLEMYPGINANSFVGPQVGPHIGTAVNQTSKVEKKTKTPFPQWWNSHHAGTEEDDVFEESEYPIKPEHDSTSSFALSDHGSSQLQRAALKEISQPRQGPASSVAFSQVVRSVKEPATTFQNPASIDPFEFPSLRSSRVAKRKAEGDLSEAVTAKKGRTTPAWAPSAEAIEIYQSDTQSEATPGLVSQALSQEQFDSLKDHVTKAIQQGFEGLRETTVASQDNALVEMSSNINTIIADELQEVKGKVKKATKKLSKMSEAPECAENMAQYLSELEGRIVNIEEFLGS